MSIILNTLDECARAFTFPMLDNGYIYPAAARMATYSSAADDWAIVIETFGFSPRGGIPDLTIHTFGSWLRNRNEREQYLAANPYNESHCVFPIAEGDWQDEDDLELIALEANQLTVRGNTIQLPTREQYGSVGIELIDPDAVHVFECCRFLSENHRNLVLATEEERRFNVPDDLTEMIVLDDWQHPNLVEKEYPSECESFQQLAFALETGDASCYQPKATGNTHWSNWPEGGSL